jgi:hypothetical protein
MILRKIGRILAVCGALMLAFGVGTLPAQGAEQARASNAPLLAPSPRPTLAPTARARGGSNPGEGMGRITGTIIDLTTGAPTTGIKVNIGGTVVSSDANGNYDLWVAAGPYAVALVLDASQGEPAQGQQMVDIAADATVILHLSFRSPPAPVATPVAANNAPAVPAEPTAAPAPVVARSGSTASKPHASPRLPRTADDSDDSLRWVVLGALLLIGGVALELGHKRLQIQFAGMAAHAARFAPGYENARLLATLLARGTNDTKPARVTENDILLAALLTTDAAGNEIKQQR